MEDVTLPLQVGMLVRVRSLEEVGEPSYGVRIQDLTETAIVVQRPTDLYRPVRFPKGSPVEISVTVEDPPGKDGRYRGESVVLRNVEEPVPVLWVAWPRQWERAQLREFFRVPVALPALLRPVVEEQGDGEGGGPQAPWIQVTMRDISGGGCLIVAPMSFERHEKVDLEFTLADLTLHVSAIVKRSQELEDTPGRWALGLEFVDIHERDRQYIIRFAFQRQIELRKKGMA